MEFSFYDSPNEKFELIDDGVKYLNPKHFSVKNLVKYCRLCIKEI